MKNILADAKVTTVFDLENQINRFMLEHGGDVAYVYFGNKQIQGIQLVESSLSDGSKVMDIRLY